MLNEALKEHTEKREDQLYESFVNKFIEKLQVPERDQFNINLPKDIGFSRCQSLINMLFEEMDGEFKDKWTYKIKYYSRVPVIQFTYHMK